MTAWVPNFDPQRAFLGTTPLWVRLPRLPLDFWSEQVLRRVAAPLGTYIRMDQVTQSLGRLGKKCNCSLDFGGNRPADTIDSGDHPLGGNGDKNPNSSLRQPTSGMWSM